MVKFQATSPDGRTILGLGLSHANLDLLRAGKPIHFNAEQMGLAALQLNEILIFAGDTEESMRADLEKHGAIDELTVVIEELTRRQ